MVLLADFCKEQIFSNMISYFLSLDWIYNKIYYEVQILKHFQAVLLLLKYICI